MRWQNDEHEANAVARRKSRPSSLQNHISSGLRRMGNLASHLDELFTAMEQGVAICDIMRENERKAGYEVVLPGSQPWLSAEDWDETVVVSKDDKHVRLVAILAKRQCQGSLHRTIRGIIAAGLIPQIVEPTVEMRTTCKRWGWRSRRIGRGFESQEVWYPRTTSIVSLTQG